ncbi:MAG TPA: LLM class flavin-dependent oxidoreductase [Acidimicrobiales bacterium]|nr:LLM class flavin-dependent oxidoreductase [Acidimicrobiales bacterium]
MSLSVHWFLPTAGDSRDVVGFGPTDARRPADLDYLAQIARTAENLGFDAVLTPTGTFCEDAWLSTAALIRETRRLRFLVAFRPGFLSPTLAAQQASTFQRLSGGRLLLNIVTGGSSEEQRRFGDHLDHDARYDRTAEFLQIVQGAWSGRPFDFSGDHYTVHGATVLAAPEPRPQVFFGGSSPAGKAVAARHADVWLMWGEPPDVAAQQVEEVRALAARSDRAERGHGELRFGIRLHVISRDRSADAWAETDRLLEAMPPELVVKAQQQLTYSESVGQARMTALHRGDRSDLVVAPNLWAGFGLVRGGAGTALVGSHDEVAERIAEYHQAGFDHFILSGQPHLEEAWWFGEGVIPRLRAADLLADPVIPGDTPTWSRLRPSPN